MVCAKKKIKTNRAFSKAEFIDIPKYLRAENLYIEKDCAGIRFYWQKDKVLVNYVYLTLKNGEFCLGTYGVTQKKLRRWAIKVTYYREVCKWRWELNPQSHKLKACVA